MFLFFVEVFVPSFFTSVLASCCCPHSGFTPASCSCLYWSGPLLHVTKLSTFLWKTWF
jgi:hypothetical protein